MLLLHVENCLLRSVQLDVDEAAGVWAGSNDAFAALVRRGRVQLDVKDGRSDELADLHAFSRSADERRDLYVDFVRHPRVARVVALSGGYTREEANRRLRRNHGVVASFSRALVEGLSAQQSDAEFDAGLDASIRSIFEASIT